jgi:hypothetical protein
LTAAVGAGNGGSLISGGSGGGAGAGGGVGTTSGTLGGTSGGGGCGVVIVFMDVSEKGVSGTGKRCALRSGDAICPTPCKWLCRIQSPVSK